jgi:hypothetical protein
MQMNKMYNFRQPVLRIIRTILFLAPVLLLAILMNSSCTYPYNPPIDDYQNLLVIDGHIVKGDKIQTINISRSSPYNDPDQLPVSGCLVNVVDNTGKSFKFTESSKGVYNAAIPDDQLKYNNFYQLFVTTPDNQNYESTQEILYPGNPIDSVYYIEEPGQTAATGRMEGIQFYCDLKAPATNTRYFRWVMEETWEYHRKYPIEVKWDQNKKVTLPRNSDTLVVCYLTMPVTGFYSTSTENLTTNEKKRIPLNYVSNQSNRLEYKYSLLLRQYSLSENAYRYFNTKKTETQESGGLYQAQPGQSFSNVVNPDNPDDKVLGYFWASSVSEKRIFATPPFKFSIFPYCYTELLDWSNSIVYRGKKFYITTIEGAEYTAPEKCFDCTKGGGKLKKPDFWK